MDKLKGKKADLKFSKRKANSRSKHYFLRNAKEPEDGAFELPGKLETERNPDISQSISSKEVSLDDKKVSKNKDTNKMLVKEKENQQNGLLSDFNEAGRGEYNKSEESVKVKTKSDEKRNDAASFDTKNKTEKPDTSNILKEEKIDKTYEELSTMECTPPSTLDSKTVHRNNEIPFDKGYDLAVERNKRRISQMEKYGYDNEILRMMEREGNASENDKMKNAIRKKRKCVEMACYLTELNSKILKELSHARREIKILSYLRKFLSIHVTPTCLLYTPHLVHTISFIRGNKSFSDVLRLAANECYNKCHVLFPIPLGSNFETVYTSEMRKFLPDDFEKFENTQFNYGDIGDLYENCDPDDYNVLIKMLYNPLAFTFTGDINRAFRISRF